MTSKLFLTALCAWAGLSAYAQADSTQEETVIYHTDKYRVETNPFWSNWFVSANGGLQVYFGDHDRQCKFGNRLAPALDVAVGKWFTPGIGVRLMYSGLQQRGATQKGDELVHSTGSEVPGKGGDGYWLEKQKFNMSNYHVDVLFSFTNLLCGYEEERIWNCSPYLGLGYARVYESPEAKEVSANIGVLNSWRLCPALELNFDIHGMYVSDRFDGEGGGRFGEGMWSATLGIAYKFKERGWGRSKTIIRYDRQAVDDLRRQLDEASAENARLRQTIAAGDKREERIIVKKMAGTNLVTFKINKSKLSNEARANLGLLAEIIKTSDREIVYTITGYADRGTGNTAINERLSRERAQAVYGCLVNEFGISPDQLRIDYKGGVENMFYDDPRLSRAVITRGE